MAESENTRTTLVVAVIGAAGAIGAALIPILLADKNPPAPQPPASATATPAPVNPAPSPVAAPEAAPAPATAVAKSASAKSAAPGKSASPPAVTKGAMSKQGGPPAVRAAVAADEARFQGRWIVVEEQARGKEFRTDALAELRPTWIVHDDNLTLRHRVDGKMVEQNHGTFRLRRGPGGRKTFDYNGTTPEGRQVEFVGIYDFEGDFLKVCFQFRRVPVEAPAERPETFAAGPGRVNLKFKRLGD
jgi:uncharacterized protein (TIGR03067 family)